MGGHQPAHRGRRAGRLGRRPAGDARLPLARGLPDRGRRVARPPAGRNRSAGPADPDGRGDGMTDAAGLDLAAAERVVYSALAEDLGDPPRDVTSAATIPAEQIDTAEIVAR